MCQTYSPQELLLTRGKYWSIMKIPDMKESCLIWFYGDIIYISILTKVLERAGIRGSHHGKLEMHGFMEVRHSKGLLISS